MSVPASKSDLLAAIEKTYSALNTDLDTVPLELIDEPFLVGHNKGTMMSPSELVSYLIGWNEQVLTWHARRASGLPDELPAAGIKWNELGVLAQRYYAEFAELSWPARRARLYTAKEALVALIETHTDDELYGAPWYGKWTMGRMISFNTSSPYVNARGRIRAGLKAAAAPAS